LERRGYRKAVREQWKIMVSKVDIVEMGSQDPQAVEAYVNAAVKHMSPAKQVALAARILKFAQQEGGTDC
ncbi:SpoVT / AbrB like domain protein, partial [human gut metagenome]